jgi:predicted GH43/DUF377 family glycosyl hydrolase
MALKGTQFMKSKHISISIIFSIITILTFPFAAGAVVNWTKYENNPVLSVGNPGAWDEDDLARPVVIKDGAVYKMWYMGEDQSLKEQIGYATSSDGRVWTKHPGNPVLLPGPSGWDGDTVGQAWVIRIGPADYRMWYTGCNISFECQIGYATSTDGIDWTKDAGNPVLSKGTGDDWDATGLSAPVVIYDADEGLYKMWYFGSNVLNQEKGIGYATSADGISWSKYNDPATSVNPYLNSDPVVHRGPAGSWDSVWVASPAVIKEDSIYRMWYHGEDSNDNSRIGFAYSTDGIDWQKYEGNPLLLEGGISEFDEFGALDPTVLKDGIQSIPGQSAAN